MKKHCIIFLLSIIISLTAFSFAPRFSSPSSDDTANYLRIHIRADSDDIAAQNVKYLVRDSIVEYLTPLVAEYKTKADAMQGIEEKLENLVEIANRTLFENGFSYTATAKLKTESFPTRVYGDYTLCAGEYSALVIELGSGNGDNWWCVIYPPLCFSGTENVVYKSKIKEIINKFFR